MDDSGPYERYYAEREAAGKRTVRWPFALLAVVVPLLVLRSFLVTGEPAEATDRTGAPAPAPVVAVTAADGAFVVGVDLEPGDYGTAGPVAGSTCDHLRLGVDGAEVARGVLDGPAQVRLADGEQVTFAGGCAWSRR